MTEDLQSRLSRRCKWDKEYTDLVREQQTIGEEYAALVKTFSAHDRSVLEQYLAVTEQVAVRKIEIAYQIGKEDGRPGGFVFF